MERLKYFLYIFLTTFTLNIHSQNVEVRFLYGSSTKAEGKAKVATYKTSKTSEGIRLRIPKEDIDENIWAVEVIPTFMKAQKGDDGYWMSGRGTYGNFDKDNGEFIKSQMVTPIYAVKKGKTLWYGHVKQWRFDYDFIARATDGKYETVLRFRPDRVRKFFSLYNDIVVDYICLKGEEADYNGVAKRYQQYQLTHSGVRTIKDRMKDYPQLDYLSSSIVVRLQTHCAKPIADDSTPLEKQDFTSETELPIEVHMPFGVAEEFLQAIKDAGVDKITAVSAGWNTGGYDGRTPQHFPVEQAIGGEAGLRRLIAKAKSLGFQITLHATNTDGYTVSPMYDPDWVGKRRDGTLDRGYLWAGGRCLNVCQMASWNKWVPDELRQMADLGTWGPHYIDVYSATYPNRCADPEHPATPEKMAEYQNKILKMSKDLMGGAASESAYDHVAANIDYINYIERDIKLLWEGNKSMQLASGVYPFWELVYHGIILYTSDRATQNHTRGKTLYKIEKSGDPRWMEGDGIVDPKVSLKIVEFGGRPIFYTYKFADIPRIKRAWDEFVPVRHLQKELMTRHEQIQNNVFLTTFEDGSRIVSNYNKTPITYNNQKVGAISYVLFNPDESVYIPKPF